MKKKKRGSVMITALWLMILLSFLAVSLGLRTRLEARMDSIQRASDEQKETLQSAVQIARFLIESDGDSNEDSPQDVWYGTHNLASWLENQDYEFRITDEESKINVNRAPAIVLKNLFQIFENNGTAFDNSPEELAASIARWRGENPIFGSPSTFRQKGQLFESLHELLLAEKVTEHDFDIISPFLTVYGRQGEQNLRINLNTAPDQVIGAVLLSLSGDDFSKKEIAAAFSLLRQKQTEGKESYWKLSDLSTERILGRLHLSSTVLMVSLVNQLLQFAGVDSNYFTVEARKTEGPYLPCTAAAVLGPTGGRAVPFMPNQMTLSGPMFYRTDNLDILSWKEGA